MKVLIDDQFVKSPIFACWRVFFPLAASMVLSSTIGILDMYLAGLIGPSAQAAVGIGDQLIFAVIVLGTGLSCATSSLVSRTAGAQNEQHCRLAILSALLIAAVIGSASTLGAMSLSSPLMKLMQCSPEVASSAIPYTVLCSVANVPFIVVLCQSAIFRALSRSDLALIVQLVTVGLCHLLSLMLFFSGFDGSRSLNALALAWVIASFIGAAVGFLMIFREIFSSNRSICISVNPENLAKVCMELATLAIPAVIAELAVVLANFVLYAVSSGLADSASAQAALTVKLKIEETVALIPIMALGMASSVIVGQNVGAGNRTIAYVSAMKIAKFGALIMLGVGALTTVFAQPIANGFSNDLPTRTAILNYLMLSVLYFPACALSTTLTNSIEGAGSTSLPMYLNLAVLIALRCACAFICAIPLNFGISGISFALCFSQFVMAIASIMLFRFFFSRIASPSVLVLQETK